MTQVKFPLLYSAIPSPYLFVMNCSSFLSMESLRATVIQCVLEPSVISLQPLCIKHMVTCSYYDGEETEGQHFYRLRIYTGHSHTFLSVSWSDPGCFLGLLWAAM